MDCSQLLSYFGCHVCRERSVVERGRLTLAGGQRPVKKVEEFLSFGRVALVLENEYPRERGNRVRVSAWRVDDGDAVVGVGGERRRGSGRCCRHARHRRDNVLTCLVGDRRKGKVVLFCVGEL